MGASTWSEPQFSEYWNWSPAAATAALGFHTPVSPSGAPCPPQPGRGWINCCSTHRGSLGCEFRSCFTSIRKAAISSKCLACRFRLRCVTGDDDYWKASIQIEMKWSETVVGLFTFAFAHVSSRELINWRSTHLSQGLEFFLIQDKVHFSIKNVFCNPQMRALHRGWKCLFFTKTQQCEDDCSPFGCRCPRGSSSSSAPRCSAGSSPPARASAPSGEPVGHTNVRVQSKMRWLSVSLGI